MAETPEDDLPPEGAEAQDVAPESGAEGGEDNLAGSAAPTLEDLARDLGWKPEDEWKGPKDNWTDAATYLRSKVEKGERVYDELRTVKSTVDRISRTTAAITDRAVAEERERLSREFREAVEAGDAEGAFQASQALQRTNQPATDADPLAEFRQRNKWFDEDEEAKAYAIAIGNQLYAKGIAGEQQVAKVEEAVRKRFPEHFDDKPQRPQQRAPVVSTTQSRAARPAPREKGPADLPPEAKRAGEDFVRRGRVKDLAEYARYYFEENA